MAETLTRKAWEKPTRKLTKEEIDELVRDFDYEAYLADFDEDADPEPSYDKYGNPSRDTLANMYEDLHGLGEAMTLEELFAEWDRMYYETASQVSKEEDSCGIQKNEIYSNAI